MPEERMGCLFWGGGSGANNHFLRNPPGYDKIWRTKGA
jgi:hypothetical protein